MEDERIIPRDQKSAYRAGQRVYLPADRCFGVLVSKEQYIDGDWFVASEGHGYQVARYEDEFELVERA